jgi:hypothetical protein
VKSVECAVLSSLRVLYFSAQKADVRVGSLKILLHVLEVCIIQYEHSKSLFTFNI